MEERESQVTIGFNYTDEFGNSYSASSTSEIFGSLGESELSFAFEQFNAFLRQCGYSRSRNYILEDDIDEEEYDALKNCLDELRAKKGE